MPTTTATVSATATRTGASAARAARGGLAECGDACCAVVRPVRVREYFSDLNENILFTVKGFKTHTETKPRQNID